MTTFKEATQALYRGLAPHGFVGRGRIWRLKDASIQWHVEIRQSPGGTYLSVDVGCAVTPESRLTGRLNDCQLEVEVGSMPLDYDHEYCYVFDMSSQLVDSYRREALQELGDAIGRYVLERQTLGALQVAYRNGEFKRGFIHHEARTLLEQGG